MARSNITQGHNFFDLVIQVVSASDAQYVLRAVIYLTSYKVIDSNNNLSVGGNWGRSGALALNGVYNAVPVWYQDITVNRAYGSGTYVSVSASWSGVEYWGATLSASESYTVPARPATRPSTPYGYSARDITSSSARTTGVSVANNGGASLSNLQAQVSTTAVEAGAALFTAGSWVDVTMTGLNRATRYYFRVRAANSAGWSDWGGWASFTTLATVPDKVTGLTATGDGPDTVQLAWTAPYSGGSAITGYDVSWSLPGGAATTVTVPATTSYRISDLLPATEYHFTVRARNYVGPGAASDLVSAVTLPGVKIASTGAFRNVRLRIGHGGGFVAVRPHIGTGGSFT